jgi:cytochrome c peroxidase
MRTPTWALARIGPIRMLGRFEVTKDPVDWGKFKTPTLRDVSKTGPYMHDGRFQTLEEVIDFYDKGGIPNKNRDEKIKKLNLTIGKRAIWWRSEGARRRSHQGCSSNRVSRLEAGSVVQTRGNLGEDGAHRRHNRLREHRSDHYGDHPCQQSILDQILPSNVRLEFLRPLT